MRLKSSAQPPSDWTAVAPGSWQLRGRTECGNHPHSCEATLLPSPSAGCLSDRKPQRLFCARSRPSRRVLHPVNVVRHGPQLTPARPYNGPSPPAKQAGEVPQGMAAVSWPKEAAAPCGAWHRSLKARAAARSLPEPQRPSRVVEWACQREAARRPPAGACSGMWLKPERKPVELLALGSAPTWLPRSNVAADSWLSGQSQQ